jgi:hypothetical protein
MRITGTIPPEDNRILVPVEFKIDAFKLKGSTEFLIDTGSTISFIGESTARKVGLDYSKLLNVGTSAGIGGQADLYEIDGFTRLLFEFDNQQKEIPRKNFLVMKHEFCEHVLPDNRKKILGLGGIFGMDLLKGWKFSIIHSSYSLEI